MFGNHTRYVRQPAIIRLFGGIGCLALAATAPASAGQPEPGRACLACMVLHVPAADTASLGGQPGSLAGLTIVVRASDPEAAPALDRLAAAGATPGLVVAPVRDEPSVDLLRRAGLLIVETPSDDDQSVFAVRTLVTAARSVRSEVRVLALHAISERIRAYVDDRLATGPTLRAPDAMALVEVSRRTGAEPLLVPVVDVDWSALATMAMQRAFGAEVVAERALTVEEIVARHQAWRRRQDQLVQRTIARGTTTLLFEVPGFVAPVTVTARTTVYTQPGVTEIEEREIRVNGGAIAGGTASSPPRLPLVEPERIATPPLAIALTDAYRYVLLGQEVLDDAAAYVVRYAARSGTLTYGRAWIDAATFALRRLETVQGGLAGAIVSSEQHDRFGRFDAAGSQVWLPVETRVYQVYEGPGHRTPIHRTIETPEYEINPADFDVRLRAAYASPHLMLRDTPRGFRYLLRDGAASDDDARVLAPRAGERIRTAVFGVLVDPNITTPLPFAGLSYVDLNLFDTGAQINAFLGGTYGQLSWHLPSIGRTRWRAHGRAFAIAARYNDRAFRAGVEQYQENITQRPAHVSAGVDRPITPRLRIRFDYELDYTAFDRADTTAATFTVPVDAWVHGLTASVDADAGPWSVRAWWNPARRPQWEAWGSAQVARGVSAASVEPSATETMRFERARAFQRFGVAAARTIALRPPVTSRVEAAWMGGTDLDRFSRHSFGAFENRLHGYPTASVRYDRGAVVRSVTSWTGRGWRLDGFADLAHVRDPGFGSHARSYPGVGAAVEVAGPLQTLWSVEWGYGFRARRPNGDFGTQAVRITGYRVF